MNIRFERADFEDIDILIEVQNQSFYADFVKYGTCPGYKKSRERMTKIISEHFVYKILCDDIVVGDVIVRNPAPTHYNLSCLCVVPEFENKGIGQSAMRFIEDTFAEARHWSLNTPADKARNHYFYKKFGFKVTKEYDCDGVLISDLERFL